MEGHFCPRGGGSNTIQAGAISQYTLTWCDLRMIMLCVLMYAGYFANERALKEVRDSWWLL